MKIRLKLLLYILFFVLLYATYYWGIPAVLNIQNRIPQMQNIVEKTLGVQVEIKSPKIKMGLSPSIWFEASSFAVVDDKPKPLTSENLKIKINLLPLLIGKFHIAYFSCDKIDTYIKIDKNYRLYIGSHLFIKESNPIISIEDSQMDINKYTIHIKDELQNKNILINGDYFNLEKYNSKEHIKFSTNSKIKINKQVSIINLETDFKLPFKKGFDTHKIMFDGSVTNLNLADFSPYIRKFSQNKFMHTTGILNIQATTKAVNRRTSKIKMLAALENFSMQAKDKDSSIYLRDKANIESIILVTKSVLNITKLKISSKGINLMLNGRVNRISTKNPNVSLSAIIKNSKSENFLSLLPSVNSDKADVNISALKRYGYYSDLNGELHINGSADKPNIKGYIHTSNGYLIKPLNIPRATLTIKFLGQNLAFDATVPTGANERIYIKGQNNLYGKKNMDLNVTSTQNVDLATTKSILIPLHEILNFNLGPLPIMTLAGQGNISLKASGDNKMPRLFGAFNFKNATAGFNGLTATLNNGEGSLYFDDFNTHFITKKAFLENKPIKIEGKSNVHGDFDFTVSSNGQNADTIIKILKSSPLLSEIQKTVQFLKEAEGKTDIMIRLKGKVPDVKDFIIGKNVTASGNIKLIGNNIYINNLQMPIKNISGNITFNNADAEFDLYATENKSKIHIRGNVKDNAIYSKIKLDDTNLSYSNLPIKIYSGSIEINKDKLTLYRINGLLDSMPVLIDGFATDIMHNPVFNIYVNSKPTQKFIDKYLNKNSLYPLKVKGDIIYSSRINGTKNSFNIRTEANLQEDSSIYYMGSTIGDSSDPLRLFIDANISKDGTANSIYINNFQYDKMISSQNNKEFVSQLLSARGKINVNKNNISLENFKIKTQNPTDAKIFNILFKKPMIKQGMFNSNITLDGNITSPKLIGYLNFTGINIPFLDTTIKDISLTFKDNDIEMKTKGEIFSNNITLFAEMENRLTPPYVVNNVDVYLGNLDINEIIKSLKRLDLEADLNKLPEKSTDISSFDITNLIIQNGAIKADSVYIKNVFAKNFTGEFSLNEKMLFSLNDYKFDVAQGHVKGNLKYNLLNSKTTLEMIVNDINANSITDALFDLPDQIFGMLNGQMELTCNGRTHKTCLNTLTGNGGFSVKDGKMPKLGSLEYLLKAANLVKSGITGLTINSIIELISPLKTGQFDNINGMFSVKSGFADNIQIFSKGKDLSLFITGTYNFPTLIADLQVFGRISKKIINVLGPIGNTSLNTLFNTIPGVNLQETNETDFIKNVNKIPGFELNDKTYRVFSAEIYGDINGDNYVQSFKWVE